MICYRWENEQGYGPYRAFAGLQSGAASHRPMPYDDGLSQCHEWHGDTWRFGFASRELTEAWFDEDERQLLLDKGFHLTLYDVSEPYIGSKQVAWRKNSATRIQVMEA